MSLPFAMEEILLLVAAAQEKEDRSQDFAHPLTKSYRAQLEAAVHRHVFLKRPGYRHKRAGIEARVKHTSRNHLRAKSR